MCLLVEWCLAHYGPLLKKRFVLLMIFVFPATQLLQHEGATYDHWSLFFFYLFSLKIFVCVTWQFLCFMFQFLICSLAFATFSVEKTLPQNRLQLSFTLVLTAVAFKSVVNSSLPRISYLTYMVGITSISFISSLWKVVPHTNMKFYVSNMISIHVICQCYLMWRYSV
jgi:hypothetical protein